LTQLAAIVLFSRSRSQVRREMLLSRTEMKIPILLSSGRCTGESFCKRCYVIILYVLTFPFIYLSLLARL